MNRIIDESEKICGECMFCYIGGQTEKLYCIEDGSEVEEDDKCRFNPSMWHQTQIM